VSNDAAAPRLLLYVDAQFASPYAMSAFVALHEKGLAFEVATVDLAANANHAAEFAGRSLTHRVRTRGVGDRGQEISPACGGLHTTIRIIGTMVPMATSTQPVRRWRTWFSPIQSPSTVETMSESATSKKYHFKRTVPRLGSSSCAS
jgi:hypothetical protein